MSRFTISMTIRDAYREQQPITLAIPCDEALRISPRAVDELRMCLDFGVSPGPDANHAVTIIRQRVMRRKLLMVIAEQLAGQLADRLEDAEGWHDPDRIDPARKQLGGDWDR